MKKNGFIATSILYSFFLVFITLFVALIMNYLHNQALLSALDEAAWDMLLEINNTRISDLEVGDYIKFKNKAGNTYLNDDSSWVVAYIEENAVNNTKKYYFLSDLNAQKLDVVYKAKLDIHPKMHAITIDVHKDLLSQNAYQPTLQFPNINISIPTSSIMRKIRSQNIDEDIMNSFYNVDGDYVIYIDDNLSTGYQMGYYYEMRTYNFNLEEAQAPIISKYCGGSFNGSKAVYVNNATYKNDFGYMHVMRKSTKNEKYVSYCSFASPIAYTHNPVDKVVEYVESAPNDIISTTYSSVYTLRLMADITVNKDANNTYIAGGKGTVLDPYILTNGVKQS